MTAAVVSLAVALAIALGALVYLVRARALGIDAELIAGKAQIAAELAQRQAEKDRDEERAARVKAEAERDETRAHLADTQTALNAALEEKAHETVQAIRSAPTAVDALGVLERLLQATARGEADPAVPARGDRGGT